MTIIGIAGCTALMLTGFGLNNSIATISIKQFDSIFVFDGLAAVSPEADIDNAIQYFDNDLVSDSMKCYQSNVDLYFGDDKRNVTLLIPQNEDELNKYIHLQTRLSNKKVKLTDDGIVINEKLSKLLGLKIGDEVTIESLENKPRKVKVIGINENYTMHYIYMTPNLFASLYQEEPPYNYVVFNMKNATPDNEDALSSSLLKTGEILGIQFSSASGKTFFEMTENLNSIVLVLIICAGILAFIVLYNLSNININERSRELATIKLLGFYDKETSSYINRENTASAFIGMLLGFFLGVLLHKFAVITTEVDIVMFNRVIKWQSFLYSGLLTMLFTFIVNFILHFKLKKIDMVESLKSIE
jgi:putative ABC transport system permease protein